MDPHAGQYARLRRQGALICAGKAPSSTGTHGFIKPTSGLRDVFVHQSAINGMEGYGELFAGDLVEFDIEQRDHGLKVVPIELIQRAAE
jgi:cold shock CspA family protein